MSDTMIKVENLSKRYVLGGRRAEKERYTALRDVLVREARALGRKTLDLVQGRFEKQDDAELNEFWALKDVSFEVKRGEVLGIIGRNGAGKSTLLKILSRITEPTNGRVELRGRVASLLEVGTGFHPELTGRENIFLNGAILGMTKMEIRKKFDEIVDFAEVERFLDTPVKRYSSGMYVRLAFSVAAHLVSEILIVDEVLSVGDSAFQNKCLRKLDSMTTEGGRTALFVSHDLTAMAKIADRGLLLRNGSSDCVDSMARTINSYLSSSTKETSYECSLDSSSSPRLRQMNVITSNKSAIHEFNKPLIVDIVIEHQSQVSGLCFAFQILNQFNSPVVCAQAYYPQIRFGHFSGQTSLRCFFPNLRLNVGRFSIKTFLTGPPTAPHNYEVLEQICCFEVVRTDEIIPWGWRPEICSYIENIEWSVKQTETSIHG